MNLSFLKSRRLRALLIAGVCVIGAAAQNTFTHTVDRGETLASIAAKYGVTTEQIITLNPDAKDFVYVGMELTIPQAASTSVATTSTSTSVNKSATPAATSENQPNQNVSGNSGGGWCPELTIEYGFLPKTKGAKNSSNFAYCAAIGANYYVTEKLNGFYVGFLAGYNGSNYHALSGGVGNYITVESKAHCIMLQPQAGYTVKASNSFGLTPYVAFPFNYCISCKTKFKEGHDSMSGKGKKGLGMAFKAGLNVNIGGFGVGVSYNAPLNKKQKGYFGEKSYVAVNIGGCFSTD